MSRFITLFVAATANVCCACGALCDSSPSPLVNDAWIIKASANTVTAQINSPSSNAPGFGETSVFMAGKIAVGIILPESISGSENWHPDRIGLVITKIMDGMQWWAQKGGAAANITLAYDIRIGVDCLYEPINISSSNHQLWVSNVFANMGYTNGDAIYRARQYLNDIRTNNEADWAMAFIVADSYNDIDGRFPDGAFAFSYIGGPYAVMTYDNDNWGIGLMNKVAAHEAGHIFYAADEYCGPYYTCTLNSSGYLFVENGNCECENPASVPCIMRHDEDAVCDFTKGHIGWRDSDGDGIADTIDTIPEIGGAFHQVQSGEIVYKGYARDIPFDSPNPSLNDVTINKITSVEYRVNGGNWQNASALDGTFDTDSEDFIFSVATPPNNPTVEIRAKNTVGNYSPIVIQGPGDTTPPTIPIVNDAVFSVSSTNLDAVWSSQDLESGIAACEYAVGSSPGATDIRGWTSADVYGQLSISGLTLTFGEKYFISVRVRNGAGLWSEAGISDGVTIVNCLGIAGARNCSDGLFSGLENVITISGSSDFDGFFYVQSEDRSSGIRVYPLEPFATTVGQTVSVFGLTGTADGERKIIEAKIVP